MAKSKIKKTGLGFVIEGTLNYSEDENERYIEVEEIGNFPLSKVFEQFNGKLIKIMIKEPDEEIFEVPEE